MNQPLDVMIRGTGMFVPERELTNAELETYFDTSDEWIRTRTGVGARRICSPGENTLTMAVEASRRALDDACVKPEDLDLIIFATVSPAYPLPATANLLADAIGATDVAGFDLAAACAGFVYGISIASSLIHAGTHKRILVVGADTMTRLADREDRASYIIFGDGAGAAVLTRPERPDQQLLYFNMGADGSGGKLIWVPAGGSAEPASTLTVNERLHVMKMKGREVYKFAVSKFQQEISAALAATGLTFDDIRWIVPHQSNLRIIESAAERLGMSIGKVYVNIERLGNTSSASVPMALDELRRSKLVGAGDYLLFVAFGAGLTWATAIVRL
jgi:3-oxoacyl-[acyl-carrier-protein] synthase-3